MSKYQMTLGSLIKALTKQREGLAVMTSTGWSPGRAHPYPGNKTDIAFVPTTEFTNVSEFLSICEQALSMPKQIAGGEFDRMGASPKVWISNIGQASKNAIIDVIPVSGTIQLVVEKAN